MRCFYLSLSMRCCDNEDDDDGDDEQCENQTGAAELWDGLNEFGLWGRQQGGRYGRDDHAEPWKHPGELKL